MEDYAAMPNPTTDGAAAPTRPVREGLFAEATAGHPAHLLGIRCGRCGKPHFPRQPTCPYCGSDEVDDIDLSSRGRLWAWTAVTAAPPGYRGLVPFGFGVVDLPEGVRVITRLTESDPSRLALGDAMELVIAPLHDDDGTTVVTYAFAATP